MLVLCDAIVVLAVADVSDAVVVLAVVVGDAADAVGTSAQAV